MTADLHKTAQIVTECEQGLALKVRRDCRACPIVGAALELLDASCQKCVLPCRLDPNPAELQCLEPPPSVGSRSNRGHGVRANEVVEKLSQLFAEWHPSKHRVNARQVVVNPGVMDSD